MGEGRGAVLPSSAEDWLEGPWLGLDPTAHTGTSLRPRPWSRANPDGRKAVTGYRWAHDTTPASDEWGGGLVEGPRESCPC